MIFTREIITFPRQKHLITLTMYKRFLDKDGKDIIISEFPPNLKIRHFPGIRPSIRKIYFFKFVDLDFTAYFVYIYVFKDNSFKRFITFKDGLILRSFFKVL